MIAWPVAVWTTLKATGTDADPPFSGSIFESDIWPAGISKTSVDPLKMPMLPPVWATAFRPLSWMGNVKRTGPLPASAF